MLYNTLPKSGTAIDVDGIISANSKKNTVNESRMDIDNDTYLKKPYNEKIITLEIFLEFDNRSIIKSNLTYLFTRI